MIRIRVIDAKGNVVSIELLATETVGKLRRLIWKKTGVPWTSRCCGRCQQLIYRGDTFTSQDNESIQNIGFDESGDVLHLIEKSSPWNGLTFLHIAAVAGENEAAKLLVEEKGYNCIDDNNNGLLLFLSSRDNDQMTALHHAANWGNIGIMDTIIGVGAHCEVVDWKGNTPLTRNTHESAVELLQCSGANIDSVDRNSMRPLHYAVFRDDSSVASNLIESGADGTNIKDVEIFFENKIRDTQTREILKLSGISF